MFARLVKVFVIVLLAVTLNVHRSALLSITKMGAVGGNSQIVLKEVSDGKNHDGHAEIVVAVNGAEIKIFAAHLHKVRSLPLKENFVSTAELKFEFSPLTNSAHKSLLQRPLLPPPRGMLV